MATEPESPATPLPAFAVKLYRPDNGSTPGAMIGLLVVLSISGIVAGFAASFIAQLFYLIILFPVFIGVVQGAIGAQAAKKLHVRGVMVGAVGGLIGGLLAMLMMHYFDYQRFKTNLAKAEPAPFMVNLAHMPAEKAYHLIDTTDLTQAEKEKLWQAVKMMRVGSLLEYMNWSAEQGVEIKHGHGSTKGINLGYAGSWIYWGVEALIVAAVTLALIKKQTTKPYCPRCQRWKTETLLGRWDADPKTLRPAVASGDLNAVRAALAGNDKFKFNIHVTLATCDQCQEHGPVDVKLESVVFDKKGKARKTEVSHVTFPPEAVTHLVGVLASPLPQPAAEEAKPGAEIQA